MKKLFFTLCFWSLWVSIAMAGNIYVDRDSSCPGSGTTGAPYCAIQSGLDAAVAGDHVRIRDSAGDYTGSTITVNGHNGAVNNPIVVEPDVGHNPNILQRMSFYDSSHWTIQNLSHNACSTSSTSATGIYVEAASVNVAGITIQGNTFSCWGGTSFGGTSGKGRNANDQAAIVLRSNYTSPYTDLTGLVTNNTISSAIETGINITASGAPSGATLVVSNNDISGTRCGTFAGYRNTSGITIGGAQSAHFNNVQLLYNHVHDLMSDTDCYATVYDTTVLGPGMNGGLIYCDAGHYGDVVKGNLLHGINWSNGSLPEPRGVGIFWENGCSNAVLSYNVVYGIHAGSGGGIQLAGNNSCIDSHDNVVHNNTLYDVGNLGALSVWNYSKNNTWKNNIVVAASSQATTFFISENGLGCGGNVIDYNRYYVVGGGSAFWYSAGFASETTSFNTWETNCNCDANSSTGDPLFVSTAGGSENFALTATSPVINAGVTSIATGITACKNGAAPDLGAFETFGVASAEVGSVDASTVTINFENNCGPPLLPASSITGFTVRKATVDDAVTAASRNGQNQIRLTVTNAFSAGNACDFSYVTASGNVTDSSLVGNTASQRLNALTTVTCTNNVGGASFTFETVDVRACSFFSVEACSSGNWVSALNQAVNVRLQGKFILRVGVRCNTADCPATGFAPWLSKNGGSYAQMVAVGDASCAASICIADAPSVTNEATTQQVTSGTFVAGKCVEVGNAVPSIDLNTSNVTELCYPLAVGSAVVTTDSFTIRMRRDDQSTVTNTVDATIAVVAPAMM